MSSGNHVKNVAVVGGTGQVGSQVVKYLLERGTFNISVISREESSATLPSGVTVKKGDYSSEEFLVSALTGIDAAVLTFAGLTGEVAQPKFIKAAAKAGVPWVIPNEYGGDTANEAFMANVPILAEKKQYRDLIEQLGVSNWIAVNTNLWIDYNLTWSAMGIDIPARTASIYDNGTTPINWTTLPQVGRAIAALLSLPITSSDGPSLSDYKNQHFYVRSVCASHVDILASAQRATHTTPEQWQVTNNDLAKWRDNGKAMVARGEFRGNLASLFGSHFTPGLGDVYHGKELGSARVGVPDEKLDDIVDSAVEFINAHGLRKFG